MKTKLDQTVDNHFRIIFLLTLILLIGFSFFKMLSYFFVPIIIGFSFTTLLYPFYSKILRKTKNRKNLSSLICCLLIVIVLLIPLFFLFQLIIDQLQIFYQSLSPYFQNTSSIEKQPIIIKLQNTKFFKWVLDLNIDWKSSIKEIVNKAVQVISFVINKSSQSVFQLVTNLLITIFCMFYFFRDGEKLLMFIKSISPLREAEETKLFNRFSQISRATVKGTLLIGLIQGSLGALTLLIFGVKTWILWGFVMVICATIPMVGTWVILVPASLFQLLNGNIWQGVLMFFISSVIIGSIDNLLRPILVGKDAEMHDLIIFFSTLGGIILFGIMGFVIGPIIAALFIALIDIYKDEFQIYLKK